MDTEYNAEQLWQWQQLVHLYIYHLGHTNHKSSWAWFLWHMRMDQLSLRALPRCLQGAGRCLQGAVPRLDQVGPAILPGKHPSGHAHAGNAHNAR